MRVGILGTGRISWENVPALLRTGRVQITALCNRTPEKAETLARAFALSVPVYSDYREMIAHEVLDVVLIGTPHDQHCEQFCHSARAGLHIMVEKPLASDVTEGRRMLGAATEAGIRAAVCHTQRYLAPFQTLRDYLRCSAPSEIGELVSVVDTLNFHFFHSQRPAWYFDPTQAGGMLFTHGAHQIDRIHFLLGGKAECVLASIERRVPGCPVDSGYQILGIAGGRSFTASCGGYPSPHTSALQLNFTSGMVRVSLFDNGIDGVGVYVGRGEVGFERLECSYREEDAYLHQFHALLDHLEGIPSDAPTLGEALDVLKVLDAAARSAREGRSVNVDDEA